MSNTKDQGSEKSTKRTLHKNLWEQRDPKVEEIGVGLVSRTRRSVVFPLAVEELNSDIQFSNRFNFFGVVRRGTYRTPTPVPTRFSPFLYVLR